MTNEITGGKLVVQMLESLGITKVFGVVGGQTLAITDAIIDSPTIELVHTRHENAAAVMADAYGRLTGRPAVAIATTSVDPPDASRTAASNSSPASSAWSTTRSSGRFAPAARPSTSCPARAGPSPDA